MAIQRLTIDGYGQLELNNVAFRRDGRVEAQLPLNADDFADVKAENGMILAVDRINGCVRTPDTVAGPVVYGLNYTAEKNYDSRHNSLKDFALEPGSFYPRIGYLAVGDKWTTNCISYDTSDYADDSALKAACTASALESAAMYAGIYDDGSMLVGASEPSAGPVLAVIKGTTMPDGQFAVKVQVIEA